MMKPKSLIKVVISALMLALVFAYVDIENLKRTLLNIPLSLIVLVFLSYVLGQFISCFKWWLIASSSIKVSYTAALRAYFIGVYCNSFGLGTVGGDVARGLILAAGKKGVKTEALASVIADRAHGLAVLCLIGIISVFSLHQDKIDSSFKVILLVGAIVIAAGWIFVPKLILRLVPVDSKFRDKIVRTLAQFPKTPSKLAIITLISASFHCLQIVANGYMALAIGVNVSWSKIFAAIPFVNIVGTLPISWQGLGVRESALMFFFGNSLSSEQAIAMGAIWFLSITASSALGGVVAMVSGDLAILKKTRASIEAQTENC